MHNKITKNIDQFYFKQFGSCVYLINNNDKYILIDTSSINNSKDLLSELESLKIFKENINIIIITHNHWDHIGNINLFPNATVYDSINIDELNIKDIKVIKTPGHTNDSICLLYKGVLFSGDTIFHNGGIGRTDFKESDPVEMIESLNKLKKINYKILCPGHI